MNTLSKRTFEFSSKKQLLLETLLQQEGLGSSRKISPQKEVNYFPLSSAQKRLWFLDKLIPNNPFYNVPAAVRIKGLLNVAVLEQSLNEIIRRHTILRTTFSEVNGNPVQVIAPELVINLPIVDMQGLPSIQQDKEVQLLISAEKMRLFSLNQSPLLRVILLKLDSNEYISLVTMHHIISDGWSTSILINEIKTLYEAFMAGRPSPLPELPIQYADFACWQQQSLQGELLKTQLAYWQQQLAGLQPLQLSTDKPRAAIQTFRGKTLSSVLPPQLSAALKTLNHNSEVTLFMTLLAAFQTLLYLYSGQEDICIGSPIANRNHSETEKLIGFFVNTIALRTNLSGDLSFQELLSRVREVALGAYANQDLPFDQLVEALQPQRYLSHHPLFQVFFTLQNTPMTDLDLPGLTISFMEIDSQTSKCDLNLIVEDKGEEILIFWVYNIDLFEITTIEQMAKQFQTLLKSIVADTTQKIMDLSLVSKTELHQLERWSYAGN